MKAAEMAVKWVASKVALTAGHLAGRMVAMLAELTADYSVATMVV